MVDRKLCRSRMTYPFIKKLFFLLPPELAHHIALKSLALSARLGFTFQTPLAPRSVFGLHFPNPVGVAAGLDKNGDYIDALASLGFGFIEVGTVTPTPQAGNPKPRLFRLARDEALINRMGFNNKGVDYLVERLKQRKFKGILGVNIGKNKMTSNENATDDYVTGFRKVAPFASYVTINISSPNTPGLRELQQEELLRSLIKTLKQEQASQTSYVPLVIKIAPDLSQAELEMMADVFISEKIDGVIATNTTLSREGMHNSSLAKEAGGLSGKPLSQRSTQVIRQLHMLLQEKIPIIGCGGIMDSNDAAEKFAAGAKLVQIYTGFIYNGPAIINENSV